MTLPFQFVCGTDVFSRSIAWYGCGYHGYSHVDMILPDGSLIGARSDHAGGKPPGVQVRKPDYEKWLRRIIVEVPATDEEATKWRDWLLSQEGKQYDQQAIWGFILGRAEHAIGHWICSAYGSKSLFVLEKIGTLPFPDSQMTPDALLVLTTGGCRGKIVLREGN